MWYAVILFFIFLFICYAVVDTRPRLLRARINVLYQLWMINNDSGATVGMIVWQEKPEYPEETFPTDFLCCRSHMT
jgi:hypothetical protein